MPVEGLLAGGLLGTVVGTVGGIVQGIQQRAEMARLRRRFTKGVGKGEARTEKETYDILQSPEYQIARSFALGTYGQEAPSTVASLDNPVSFAGKTFYAAPTGDQVFKPDRVLGRNLARQLDEVLGAQRQLAAGVDSAGKPLDDAAISRLRATVDSGRGVIDAVGTLDAGQLNMFGHQLGRYGLTTGDFQKFRASTLGGAGGLPPTATATAQTGIETPLSRQFKANLGQSMISRGIYDSQAAAAAEASGLAAFEYEQQQRMLPTLLGLSTYGSDVYHRYESANISREVAKATGGVGVYGQANPFIGGSPAVSGIQGGLSGLFSGASLGANLQNAFAQQDFNQQYLDLLRKQMKVG